MIDYDHLVEGLGKLYRGEVRHVWRYVTAVYGGQDIPEYDAGLAVNALSRLTPEEQENLVTYFCDLYRNDQDQEESEAVYVIPGPRR